MRFITGDSEAGRRLDRVLKKYFKNAPLSFIYRMIRRDVKVNGRRAAGETLLQKGDVVEIFLPEDRLDTITEKQSSSAPRALKQFTVVFEDENILITDKPFGLLVHGDRSEKKNTLTNQVISYLSEEKPYVPGQKEIFVPAPANRLDRNTTGLVAFGKNLPAARDLALILKGREDGNMYAEKSYLTIVKGRISKEMKLTGRMVRDGEKNVTDILPVTSEKGRLIITEVIPLKAGKEYTLVEARLHTGRTHQIRAQLADAGFPVIGDRKYGDGKENHRVSEKYGLTTQLLHAYRLVVLSGLGSLDYLEGKTFRAKPPERFTEIMEDLGCGMNLKS